ncbi:hypothetical protein POSPLADRAFT_1127692 [Postia placenta MAD-698-R-SB12]|uniref:CN hydrolase domain-containing protein n=1 Tax=Postia placenta MAD-698-R-SB12 TaxID=670580 RepID=A0A1X6NFM9_9APHY|nr:hypothetical protein POSPLADRAFT_1127692 [Postia placenta MAD-698-R-SB12]OSX67320.1 hypothetical protein POSPLADRAFT_1127692 [Postia placenta MAD-698-R-SB12]
MPVQKWHVESCSHSTQLAALRPVASWFPFQIVFCTLSPAQPNSRGRKLPEASAAIRSHRSNVRGNVGSDGVAQVIFLSLAAAVTHHRASYHALSSGPTLSIVVLSFLSAITATISLATIGGSYYINRVPRSPWSQLTVFPALWATVWGVVANISPVGRLATWSPVVGFEAYEWIRPVFGQFGIDWLVAAWAVVGAHTIGNWLVGSALAEDVEIFVEEEQIISFTSDNLLPHPQPVRPRKRSSLPGVGHVLVLAGTLVCLAAPSFVISSLPLPAVSSLSTTSLDVACALPDLRRSGVLTGAPGLNDFKSESKMLENSADIILWPEGAVHFESSAEKEAAFEKLSSGMSNKKLYGISFEEYTLRDMSNGTQKEGIRRNGFALLSKQGLLMEYYKQHLVPKSFSLTASSDPPEIYTWNLGPPKGWNKTAWSPQTPSMRPIPLTASICLDFSTSASFSSLEERPALILAPARTWHTSVGYAMWEQARARAEELGSVVLWCDGGAGGVSGVAGGGMREFVQVGQGSWVRQIGIAWPFDQRRTFFSRGGGWAAVGAAWGIVGVGAGVEILVLKFLGVGGAARIVGKIRTLAAAAGALSLRRKREEQQPLLPHDLLEG